VQQLDEMHEAHDAELNTKPQAELPLAAEPPSSPTEPASSPPVAPLELPAGLTPLLLEPVPEPELPKRPPEDEPP
jgi:hypothetical protein